MDLLSKSRYRCEYIFEFDFLIVKEALSWFSYSYVVYMPASRRTRRSCEHPATMNDLTLWHKSMFETLGWMVLAKEYAMEYKVTSYKESLRRLCEKLECKMETVKEDDHKMDLKIMCDQVECLLSKVDTIL